VKELIASSTSSTIKTALEYGDLATRPELVEADVDRMKFILTQASNDPVLNFWIDEIDHCLAHQLDLLDQDSQHDYERQQRLLERNLAVLIEQVGLDLDQAQELELTSRARDCFQAVTQAAKAQTE
jgi:hypothetical protein